MLLILDPTSMDELNLLEPSPPGPLVFLVLVLSEATVILVDLVVNAGSLVSSFRTVPF